MTLETTVNTIFSTQWDDFTIVDKTVYDTDIDITQISASDEIKDIVLGLSKYTVADGTGYGVSEFEQGPTEQQAYEEWIVHWNRTVRKTIKALENWQILKLSQNRLDALCWLNWELGQINTVQGIKTYDLKHAVIHKQWDTAANMIKNSIRSRISCRKIAAMFRLAQYEKPVTRISLRTNGINQMRTVNQVDLNTMDSQNLKRIRFAYYAETAKFLAFTPESVKRDIAKKYNDTLIQQQFIYSGTNVFEIQKQPSMYPVEKLQVKLNGEILQHYFDFTLDGRTLTVLKDMNVNDIIDTTIKI